MKKTILYFHGFLSSPQSLKAQQTKAYIEQYHPEIDLVAPQLPNHPDEIQLLLNELLTKYESSLIGFIGSSLGGYIATWCCAQKTLPTVIINPAAYPYILLADYLGWHEHPYTQERFAVTPCFNQHLRELDIAKPNCLPIWLLLQTGDETIDYKQAVNKYEGCLMTIEQGGNHAFENFAQHLPQIIEYLTVKA